MSNVTISQLVAGSALTGVEPFPMVQSGNTVKATAAQIATYVLANPVTTGTITANTIITPATNTDLTINPNGSGQILASKNVVVTGLVSATTSIKSSSATSGVGYATGAGGTVTQATSKATPATLSKVCGTITTAADALAANTTVSFVLTNTASAVGDVMVLNHISGGTVGSYTLNASCGAGTVTIYIRNVTSGSLSEALVIGFAIVKAVTA